MLKRHCQSTLVGGAWVRVMSHSQESELGLISERDFGFIGIFKKNTGWIFMIIGWLCTHSAKTHFSSNNM